MTETAETAALRSELVQALVDLEHLRQLVADLGATDHRPPDRPPTTHPTTDHPPTPGGEGVTS